MKIGIFGGSFDPVHYGHLILAERCRESVGLDQVWFMPCSLGPHKQDGAHGSDRQRLEMLDLALSGHESFLLSRIELDRGGVSYTVDTLKQIRETNPDDQLFFLLGDDSLENFENWREPEQILEMARLRVVNRPGSGEVDYSVLMQFVDENRYEEIRETTVECPMIEISSSDIRKRLQAGKSIRYLTPRSVEKYIETQKVY